MSDNLRVRAGAGGDWKRFPGHSPEPFLRPSQPSFPGALQPVGYQNLGALLSGHLQWQFGLWSRVQVRFILG